ncbi:MAG TPA: phosphopantetheine adenylyltransferase [Candidatus Acidoferrum sp.]|nr:phosphopantetheine adenylyltransferase [Candidatus Acidoferrum sp.]
MKKYNKVAVGGTFDELHMGHKALISKAFEVGEKIVIGLSSDEFVSKMSKTHKTASYSERFKELYTYLENAGLANRAEIVPLKDPYGLTISGKDLDALVVSKETKSIAEKINEVRNKAGLKRLKIVTVDMVQAENSIPISTTRIRKGEIDRNGHMMKITQKQ